MAILLVSSSQISGERMGLMKKTFAQLVIEFKEVEGVFISSKKQSIVVLTLDWTPWQ